MEENVLISFKYDALNRVASFVVKRTLLKILLVRKSCVKLIAVNKQTHIKKTLVLTDIQYSLITSFCWKYNAH